MGRVFGLGCFAEYDFSHHCIHRLFASESQVHWPVLLRQSSLIRSPLSIGIFPKQIFLPSFWKTLPAECRTVLIKHELAHIKRRDGIVQFLQILMQAVYFFHPLVWLLNERINEYREMACDDTAVKEAAVLAIKSVIWKPAKQKGKPVPVWVGIPVVFKLNRKNDR